MLRAAAGAVAGLVGFAAAGQALAQIDIPVFNVSFSPQGVNLATGQPSDGLPGVAIGDPKDGGLSVTFYFDGYTFTPIGDFGGGFTTPTFHHSLEGWVATNSDGSFTVHIGRSTDNFSSTYVSLQGNGSTLAAGTGSTLTYTDRNGTVATFSGGKITSLTKLSGEKLVYTYGTYGSNSLPALANVKNNFGYEIDFTYDTTLALPIVNSASAWNYNAGSTGSSAAVSVAVSWNSSTGHYQTVGPLGTSALTVGSCGETATAIAQWINYTYDGSCRVSAVTLTDGGSTVYGTWTYGYADSGSIRTVTVTDPLSHTKVSVVDKDKGLTLSETDGLSHTTTYQYDTYGRMTYAVSPEGTIVSGTPTQGYIKYNYDSRGNVTSTERKGKTGSATITTSAHFACTYPAWCNEPDYTIDERGHQTTYTYDNTTGLVTSVTSDSITSFGASETQTAYTALPGVTGMPSVYRPTTVTTCATSTTCGFSLHEVKTTFTYGSVDDPNVFSPRTVSIGAGNASSSTISTTTLTYSLAGDLATSDGPLSGSGDLTRYAYDTAHNLKSVVGADPDGSDTTRTNPVVRTTYDDVGRPLLVEVGKVPTSTTDPWGSSFTLKGSQQTIYDNAGRKVFEKVVGDGGGILSITQTNYDAAGRVNCVAQRMIAAAYTDLPTSACDQSGHRTDDTYDRITQYSYDSADRVTSVALINNATSTTLTQAGTTYTNDGLRSTLTDANGNTTTYEYDAFDRLYKTRYPNTSGGGSSTSDYEQYTLDDAGNVTGLRMRSGTTYTAAYDVLNRQTTTFDGQTIVYDNLSRPVSVTKSSATVSYAWGALGQKLSEEDQNGHVVYYSYDLAGRRTQMIWPDSHLTIDYDWYLDGVKTIREDGVTSGPGVLATYAYDDLGRRTSITRGNGTSTSYAYETDSTLKTLTQTITSASNTTTLARNRAGQIVSKSITNDSYAGPVYANGANVSTSYNGLNQISTTGFTHLNGNVTSDGTNSYGYDTANRMTSAAGATLVYDPIGRLASVSKVVSGTTVTTQFAYDGTDVIADYNGSGTLQNRYIQGPGDDEVIGWYAWSGTANTRHYLAADERGSIVAITNDSGTIEHINGYDEYGRGGSSNFGRFQYTGQMWLDEAGLYHYKARAYSPKLGRFLQTDPIGYDDGPNWYIYAHDDPINSRDPTGAVVGGAPDGVCWTDLETGQKVCQMDPVGDPVNRNPCAQAAAGVQCTPGGVINISNYPVNIPVLDPVSLPPVVRPKENGVCSKANTGWGKLADFADKVNMGAGGVALGSGFLALATSETVVGGIGFGAVAGGAELVSLGAAGVSTVANWFDGRHSRSIANVAVNGVTFGSGKILEHYGEKAIAKAAEKALAKPQFARATAAKRVADKVLEATADSCED